MFNNKLMTVIFIANTLDMSYDIIKGKKNNIFIKNRVIYLFMFKYILLIKMLI